MPLNEAEKRDIAALQKQIVDLEQRRKFANEMAKKSTGFVQRLGAEFNEIRKQSPETAGLNFIPKGNQVAVDPRRFSEIDRTNDPLRHRTLVQKRDTMTAARNEYDKQVNLVARELANVTQIDDVKGRKELKEWGSAYDAVYEFSIGKLVKSLGIKPITKLYYDSGNQKRWSMTKEQMGKELNNWFHANKNKFINHLETTRFKDLPDEGRESDGSLQSIIDAENELNAARKEYMESLNQVANQYQDFVISIPLHVEREYYSRIVR